MKKLLIFLGLVIAVACLTGQTYHRPYTITVASLDTGATGAAVLAVEFKSITIRADPNNTGVVCVGTSSAVTCQAGIATAATDGFKLQAGESITLSEGGWPESTLYLNNTTANDYVTYIVMN